MPLDPSTQRTVGIVAGKLPNWYLEQQRSQNHVSLRPIADSRQSQSRNFPGIASGSAGGYSWRQRGPEQSGLTEIEICGASSNGACGDDSGFPVGNEEQSSTKVMRGGFTGHVVGGEQSAG